MTGQQGSSKGLPILLGVVALGVVAVLFLKSPSKDAEMEMKKAQAEYESQITDLRGEIDSLRGELAKAPAPETPAEVEADKLNKEIADDAKKQMSAVPEPKAIGNTLEKYADKVGKLKDKLPLSAADKETVKALKDVGGVLKDKKKHNNDEVKGSIEKLGSERKRLKDESAKLAKEIKAKDAEIAKIKADKKLSPEEKKKQIEEKKAERKKLSERRKQLETMQVLTVLALMALAAVSMKMGNPALAMAAFASISGAGPGMGTGKSAPQKTYTIQQDDFGKMTRGSVEFRLEGPKVLIKKKGSQDFEFHAEFTPEDFQEFASILAMKGSNLGEIWVQLKDKKGYIFRKVKGQKILKRADSLSDKDLALLKQ